MKLTRRSFITAAGLAMGMAAINAPLSATAEVPEGMIEVEDMMGRKVVIPAEVNSCYCAVPTGEAMVATIAPFKIIGWVSQPTERALGYLPEQLATLPVLGGWMGQEVTANIEDIIATAPDVIIYMANNVISPSEAPDDIQTKTGIPVLVASSSLADTPESYRRLGEWLGDPERGEELASWYENRLAELTDAIASVPEDRLPRIYYAENADGLATDPAGSTHTEVIDFCRAINVADVEMKGGQGRTDVNIEQIIGWDPEMVLCHSGFLLSSDIYDNPMWADITAVKEGRVYTTPALPFNWFDRPPNCMRVLGIEWFANICYPELGLDIEGDVREFFQKFFLMELTDEQLEQLLYQDEVSFIENAR